MSNRYFVRAEDVPAYHPANHTGTVNKRLIDPKLTGAKNIEIVCGTLQPGNGALPRRGRRSAPATRPRRLLLFSCRHAACLHRDRCDTMQSSRHLLATLRGRLKSRHPMMRWTD